MKKKKWFYLNIRRKSVSLWSIPKTRSQIIRLWTLIRSTSVEILSNSSIVVNSTMLAYAGRRGTWGNFAKNSKLLIMHFYCIFYCCYYTYEKGSAESYLKSRPPMKWCLSCFVMLIKKSRTLKSKIFLLKKVYWILYKYIITN